MPECCWGEKGELLTEEQQKEIRDKKKKKMEKKTVKKPASRMKGLRFWSKDLFWDGNDKFVYTEDRTYVDIPEDKPKEHW